MAVLVEALLRAMLVVVPGRSDYCGLLSVVVQDGEDLLRGGLSALEERNDPVQPFRVLVLGLHLCQHLGVHRGLPVVVHTMQVFPLDLAIPPALHCALVQVQRVRYSVPRELSADDGLSAYL